MAHAYAETLKEKQERAHDMVSRTGHKSPVTKAWDEKQDHEDIARGVHKHESALHPGKPKTKLKFGGHVEGKEGRHHLAKRARGGHAGGGKKGTHVNVVVAPQGGGAGGPPGGGMMPSAAPPPRPMPPPQVAPPPRPPMPPGGGMAPPGMMPPGGRPPGMMQRGGGIKKTSAVGVPSESLMQANRGGKARHASGGSAEDCPDERQRGGRAHRDMGGPMPQGGQQPTPQQIQQMMAMRQQQGAGAGGQPGMGGQGPTPQQMQMMQARRQQMMQQQGGQPPPPGMQPQKRGGRTEKRAEGGKTVHMDAGAGGGEGRREKTHEYGEGGFKPELMMRDRKTGRFLGGSV